MKSKQEKKLRMQVEQEVRQKITKERRIGEELMQDRRRALDLLESIRNQEFNIKLLKKRLDKIKVMLSSGVIEEKKENGDKKSIEDLKLELEVGETRFKSQQKALKYYKEDFFFKTRNFKLDEFKEKINRHYALVEEYYNKATEVFE